MKLVTAAALLSLALVGCSGGTDTVANDARVSPVPAETAASTPSTSTSTAPVASPSASQDGEYGAHTVNARGNLVKQLGQLAGTTSSKDAGVTLSQFTITGIEPGFKCTSKYADPPANGTFIAITMDIQTAPELAQDDYPYFDVSANDFKVISPDGTRENDSVGKGYMCLNESEALPDQIGPGEHVTGKLVLDSANTNGSIVFSPFNISTGWEWGF